MASTPRPPRRPVGSRNPTARPRKVAGATGDSAQLQQPEPVESAQLPEHEPVESAQLPEQEPVESAQLPEHEPVDETAPVDDEPKIVIAPGEAPEDERPSRPLGSLRTTVGLLVALVLLLGVAAAESWYVWGRDEPVLSASSPVVSGEMAQRTAVDTASEDVGKILSTSYQDYDAQVDDATSRMTDTFAAQYRKTAEQIKDQFVAQKTEVQSQVVAAGVMNASSERVEALIFVNQATTKDGKDTSVSQYRVKMTMLHTAGGWLVDGIDTN